MSEPVKHDGYTEESLTEYIYKAGCSCGWTSSEYSTKEEAESALALHYRETQEEITQS